MATGSILLGIALLVLVGLFIARPFLRSQEDDAELSEYQLLLLEKDHLLDQIQELDFDHETGKLPTQLHELQRAKLMEQATAVLQAIDQASGAAAAPPAKEPAADNMDVDIEIEAAIARMRRQRSQKAVTPAPAAASTVSNINNGHARFCPQCGAPTDLGDKFCANCGHNLTLKRSTKTA